MINCNKFQGFALMAFIIGALTSCSYDRDIESAASPIIPSVESQGVEVSPEFRSWHWSISEYSI